MIYVALGDSTGVGIGAIGGGYPARVRSYLLGAGKDVTLVNLCVSGATSAEVLRSQLAKVAGHKPDLVSLGIGINDVTHGVSVVTFARHCAAIIERLLAETTARIVVCNIPNFSHAPSIPVTMRAALAAQVELFNAEIGRIAAKHPRVVVVDVHGESKLLAARVDFFSRDGFHPSDVGYQYWAEVVWKAISAGLVV